MRHAEVLKVAVAGIGILIAFALFDAITPRRIVATVAIMAYFGFNEFRRSTSTAAKADEQAV